MTELEIALAAFHSRIAETDIEPFSLTCDNDDDEESQTTINNDTTIDGFDIDIVL